MIMSLAYRIFLFYLLFLFLFFVVLYAKLHNKNSELDEVRGFICITRRPNHTVAGIVINLNQLIFNFNQYSISIVT